MSPTVHNKLASTSHELVLQCTALVVAHASTALCTCTNILKPKSVKLPDLVRVGNLSKASKAKLDLDWSGVPHSVHIFRLICVASSTTCKSIHIYRHKI